MRIYFEKFDIVEIVCGRKQFLKLYFVFEYF